METSNVTEMPQVVSTQEQRNREAMALRIARWMYGEMIRIAREADEAMWAATAANAGEQRIPSEKTREMVIEILRGKQPK